MTYLPHNQRGYTLLFAVLTAALVLGVAVFILDVSRKQYILSASARDSMFALYAADGAKECAAMAWYSGTIATDSPTSSILCDYSPSTNPRVTFPVWTRVAFPGFASSPLPYQTSAPVFFPEVGTCAQVIVTIGSDENGDYKATLDSRGYNIGSVANHCPDTSSPSVVERALRLTYGAKPPAP